MTGNGLGVSRFQDLLRKINIIGKGGKHLSLKSVKHYRQYRVQKIWNFAPSRPIRKFHGSNRH
jgi:hypothetical protein